MITSFLSACRDNKNTNEGSPVSSSEEKDSDADGDEGNVIAEGDADMMNQEGPKGTLTRLRYETDTPMIYGAMFWITVTKEEIEHARYYPGNADGSQTGSLTEKEHLPITQEEWADIAGVIDSIRPLLKEIPADTGSKNDEADDEFADVHVLDGGDYSRLFLSFNDGSGEVKKQYFIPQDRRILTLEALLHEVVDHAGREIPRFGDPVLTGIYFHNDRKAYSYQCTQKDPETGEHWFFAYYKEGLFDEKKISTTVPESVWEEINAYCKSIGLETFDEGGYRDKISVTLYYDDGKQPTVTPDKENEEKLRKFLHEIALRC